MNPTWHAMPCHALPSVSCRDTVMARHKMGFHAIYVFWPNSISCHGIILCFAYLCYDMLCCPMLTHLDVRELNSFRVRKPPRTEPMHDRL